MKMFAVATFWCITVVACSLSGLVFVSTFFGQGFSANFPPAWIMNNRLWAWIISGVLVIGFFWLNLSVGKKISESSSNKGGAR